jgi:hypothetical protein
MAYQYNINQSYQKPIELSHIIFGLVTDGIPPLQIMAFLYSVDLFIHSLATPPGP